MPDIYFKPFGDKEKHQKSFLINRNNYRIRCLFAAKRSGKSEACYVDTILKASEQPGYVDNGRDPYLIAIVAPTTMMLRRLVWAKFRKFAKPFEREFNISTDTFYWNENNTIIYGCSAEKISRIEGLKLNHVHMTEAFQMKQEVIFEVLARLSDTQGSLTIDGSLGPQLINPKQHWLYKMFIEKKFEGSRVWQWASLDNPYFPKEEIELMRNNLDPQTFRAMFEIDWDTIPQNAVYSDFGDENIVEHHEYDPHLETYVCIDWGWAHPMACLFFQYDREKDRVFLFDEIVESKMTLDTLYNRIIAKGYKINDWICDIAGNQEREQTGQSNVNWFYDKGIVFKKRKTAVNYGIPIVRSYIKNTQAIRRFFISKSCSKSIDGIKRYRYNEKDGIIQNENPVKEDDDAVDAIRYFYVNILDPSRMGDDMPIEFY